MIVTFQPAGKMKIVFMTVLAFDHEPAKQEMATIFEEHDMENVGPVLIQGKK